MKELTEGMKHSCYQLNLTSKSQHDCEDLNASEQMLESMEKNLLVSYYAHSFTQTILKVITPRTQKNPQNPVNRCQNLGKGLAHKGKAP